MDLGISGRTALVTGSSKGLGLGSALALGSEGANVVICARSQKDLDRAEQQVAATGAEVLAIQADVTVAESPARLVDEAVERFGSLDILVANSGGPPPGGAFDRSDADFEAAVNSNLLTSIRLTRAAVVHMKPVGWGRICFITSTSIKEPIPSLMLSNVARTGLWAWAKTAAKELFEDGITLNLACPGLHDTARMRELGAVGAGTVGDPNDFGKAVAFLCSEPAKYISGTAISIDGARVNGLV